MGQAVIPDGVLEQIKDLEKRTRALESASRLQTSSLRDGSLKLQDQTGNNLVVLGKQSDGISHGITISAVAGFPLWEFIETRGLMYPAASVPMRQASNYEPVSSGSFLAIFGGSYDTYTANAYYSHIGYNVPAGTTGELYFSNGFTQTSTLSLGGPSFGYIEVAWSHGVTLGEGPATGLVWARRTAGAGNVNIFMPDFFQIIDGERVNATASPGIAFI